MWPFDRLPSLHEHRRMNTCFVVYRRFDRVSPRLETVNLLHFGKNNDPGHSTNLSLHSRKVTGEARGIPCILENADGSVVVGHAPTALVFLDIISGVVAANAGDALGPCGPWIAHPRAIRNALTRAKRIGQPTASARTKFGSLVCGATRRRNTKTAAAASQTKSRVPEDRRLNLVWSSSVLIARLQRSTPTIGTIRLGQKLIRFRYGYSSPILREHKGRPVPFSQIGRQTPVLDGRNIAVFCK
jgi:hypothetical protein